MSGLVASGPQWRPERSRGGIIRVAAATGLSRGTIRAGLRELDTPAPPDGRRPSTGRLRRPGGGRKPLVGHDPGLLRDLEALVDPVTRGDPMSPLRWTCKSAAKLAAGLRSRGHTVSERTVNRLLHDLGYSLQANRKTTEGKDHPDRDAQFRYINRRAKAFQRQGQPAVSVDTKKKELVGRYRNGGREWQPKGQPEEVKVHDFIDKDLGKAIPYGVYDLAADKGWVSVGVDHDTAGVRRGDVATVVAADGQPGLPPGEEAVDHGRWGRLQRDPLPAVDGGIAATSRRGRAPHLGVPLPAGHEQVEQDRALAVLPHHGELAGPAVGEP